MDAILLFQGVHDFVVTCWLMPGAGGEDQRGEFRHRRASLGTDLDVFGFLNVV